MQINPIFKASQIGKIVADYSNLAAMILLIAGAISLFTLGIKPLPVSCFILTAICGSIHFIAKKLSLHFAEKYQMESLKEREA